MANYIAYHSTRQMGYAYTPTPHTIFLSRKSQSFLERAISERVWIIDGTTNRSKTNYRLISVYRPEEIVAGEDCYEIRGPLEFKFHPPIAVDSLDWFRELYKEQNNFSLGFNTIKSPGVTAALEAILDKQRAKQT